VRRCVLIALGILGCAQAGVAQPAPKEPDWVRIRKDRETSAIDKPRIREWVEWRVDRLFSADDAFTDGADFYRTLTTHFLAADATAGFKNTLAEIVGGAIADRYKPEAGKSMHAVFALMTLNVYKHPSSFDVYQRALQDPAAGPRLLAAKGLMAIRENIQAQQWTALLPGIQKIGATEANPAVLEALYRLLSVGPGPRVGETLPVVLAILDARLGRIEKQNEWPTLGDADMVSWLAARFASIGQGDARKSAVLAAARLLADSVHQYLLLKPPADALKLREGETIARLQERLELLFGVDLKLPSVAINTGDSDEKLKEKKQELYEKTHKLFERLASTLGASPQRIETTERIIRTSETALKSMTKVMAPARTLPDVTKAMLAGDPALWAQNMRLECNKWIGTAQVAGLLNEAPFSFERGLGVKWTPPGQGSQPAP
jgi:hypothetical protein